MHAICGGAAAEGGGGGRLFVAGDRCTRPTTHLQALKCPRCDSVNTKFCYYNNYNLQQPRHFCKSCRRYWTKGGVLRNVTVGGGYRKTKGAKQRSGGGATSYGGSAPPKAQSSSSTENSGLAGAAPAAEEGSAPISAGNTAPISAVVYDYSDASFFNENPNFGNPTAPLSQPMEGQIFPTEFGGFGGLTASSEMMRFSLAYIPTTSYPLQLGFSVPAAEYQLPVPEFKLPELKGGMSDEGMGAAAAPEWGNGAGVEQGLFDLTAAVDPAYWSQPHWSWTDTDQSSLNYLP